MTSGCNIDAEEADRLELSLDLLESLASIRRLAGWNGLGFVVQAYGKRCPFVLDWIIDLARRVERRIMVRLVKGAYWDAEIKRAQVDGLTRFPGLYAQGPHRRRLYRLRAQAAGGAATRCSRSSRRTMRRRWRRSIIWPGRISRVGDYEFQCLHGMGEPLYDEVVGPDKLGAPVPHLCAGRHARDAARLSGAAAAGERRELVLRQPHRRPGGAGRRADRRSGRDRCGDAGRRCAA